MSEAKNERPIDFFLSHVVCERWVRWDISADGCHYSCVKPDGVTHFEVFLNEEGRIMVRMFTADGSKHSEVDLGEGRTGFAQRLAAMSAETARLHRCEEET
jgi:hypothetical protein